MTSPQHSDLQINYGKEIETEITFLSSQISELPDHNNLIKPRWLAIQLLEGDQDVLQHFSTQQQEIFKSALIASFERLRKKHQDDLEIAITSARYSYANQIVNQVMTQSEDMATQVSDRIDKILTHRYLGLPIFLFLMYLVFSLMQNIAAPFVDWLDHFINGPLSNWILNLLVFLNTPVWINSLVIDGIVTGVGGVLIFLPSLMVIFFALAILEDTGYLSRAAFLMDNFTSKLGLQGKAFIPLILGFGCNVPAIYATRTIESRSARLLTGLLIPFMSCSARLPIYVIFSMAFFPNSAELVIWSMYSIGILIAAVVGVVLSRTVFRNSEASVLLIELPPYRLPTLRGLIRPTWENSAGFVRKAGTFILGASIILWSLMHLPVDVDNPRDSYFGNFSQAISPLFTPAGFGNWQSTGSLITGLMAKEAVISTMAQLYIDTSGENIQPESINLIEDIKNTASGFVAAGIEAGKQILETFTPGIHIFEQVDAEQNTALSTALQQYFTPLSAFSFLLFVLLYIPCAATIGALVQEFGWRWASLSVSITLIVPWVISVFVFQAGRLLGLDG
jgi:ferrous iron transport protein B